MTPGRRVVVVGGGIVGLAVAERVLREDPSARVTVRREGARLGPPPDRPQQRRGALGPVLPARQPQGPLVPRRGATSLLDLARDEGVPHAVTGKLVVATAADRAGPARRPWTSAGWPTASPSRRLTGRRRPASTSRTWRRVAALHVARDRRHRLPRGVPRARPAAARRRCPPAAGHRGRGRRRRGARGRARDDARRGGRRRRVVSCAGPARRPASPGCSGTSRRCASCPSAASTASWPPDAAHLVRGLVYPVPDPALPFLGVHLTRGIDGHVHAGPNAVLALAREGYAWGEVDATRPRRHARRTPGSGGSPAGTRRSGAAEVVRSLSRRRFADSVRRLVPEVADADLVPAPAGVRAQAVRRDGTPRRRLPARAARPGRAPAQRTVTGGHGLARDRPPRRRPAPEALTGTRRGRDADDLDVDVAPGGLGVGAGLVGRVDQLPAPVVGVDAGDPSR